MKCHDHAGDCGVAGKRDSLARMRASSLASACEIILFLIKNFLNNGKLCWHKSQKLKWGKARL